MCHDGTFDVWANTSPKIVVGSCTLKDGGIYTGELIGGKPGGKGRVQYENGDTYEGTFVKGLRQGEGTFTAADGSRYEGNWTKTRKTVRVHSMLSTTTVMLAHGIVTKKRALAPCTITMVIVTKASGKVINATAAALIHTRVEPTIKAIGWTTKRTVRASSIGMMAQSTKVVGLPINAMVVALTSMLTVITTMAIGK